MSLHRRFMFYTLLGLALYHWGAAVAVTLCSSHIQWIHFSAVATVLTVSAAYLTPRKGP
jgi:hypothetical protein